MGSDDEKKAVAIAKLFGIKRRAVEIFMIMGNEETLESLSRKTGLAIPSLSRYLNVLVSAGLVKKTPRCCIGKRGRYFVYGKVGGEELVMLAKEKASELVEAVSIGERI